VRDSSIRLVVCPRTSPSASHMPLHHQNLPIRPKALASHLVLTFGVSFSQPSHPLANCRRRALPAKTPFRNAPASETLRLAPASKDWYAESGQAVDLRGVLHQCITYQGRTRSAGLSDCLPRAALMARLVRFPRSSRHDPGLTHNPLQGAKKALGIHMSQTTRRLTASKTRTLRIGE
jgi:hypothetical protein